MKRIATGLVCLVMGAAGLFACGSDDEEKDITPFLGAWNLSQAAVAAMCASTPYSSGLAGSLQVSKGTASDLVVSFTDPALAACVLRLNVKNGTASAVAGQTCTFAVNQISGTFTINTGTLLAVGTSGSLNVGGTVATQLGPLPVMCNATVTSTLSRSVSDAGAADAAP